MTYQSDFIPKVLRDLQSRTEAAAKRFPGLRHMLVLPPGETVRIPAKIGVRAVGFSNPKQRLTTSRFGKTKLVGPLPPRISWPKGIEPLRAVVAEQEFLPYRPNAQEPYRIHLFFGGSAGALEDLQALADDLDGIRHDVTRALYGDRSPFLDDVFYTEAGCLHDDSARRLDAWLCTVHWWAWVWTECPFRTRPQVVYAESTYETDPRDDAVESKLALSMFDADVLTASAQTLSLILRFFDEPPAPFWFADYPDVPKADEMLPADVASLGERFIRYVTNYLESEKVLRRHAANAHPTEPDSYAETDNLKRIEESSGRKNEAAAQIRRYGPALAAGLERYGCDSVSILSVVHCAGSGGGGPSFVLPTWEQSKTLLQRDVFQLRQANAAPSPQSKADDVPAVAPLSSVPKKVSPAGSHSDIVPPDVAPPAKPAIGKLMSELTTGPSQTPPAPLEADAPSTRDGTPQVADAASRKPRVRRGRKPDTDPKDDKRIAEAWASRQYKTFADMERELNLSSGAGKRAVDRHRKRK